ncbi:hypothetical protein [Adhaeretor mobilis]|uniref:Uncharacterized protein n=1 Tax=Adhaeretor mobilis TaxID=1930276 RepID=A0A517N2X2_9BACT|nr:hypothetical protein [Adhaeretor mobilis]QDT01482.1 hypothetical protein HG15A2_48240 [Adhaeretor mobilis]
MTIGSLPLQLQQRYRPTFTDRYRVTTLLNRTWDAVEVVEFTCKHTAKVGDGLTEIRRLIERLVAKRDERRDGFVRVVSNAMRQQLRSEADEVVKNLTREGIPRGLAAKATQFARESGRFSIFSLVDALTRLAQEVRYAGDRVEIDAKAASLLALAV